MMFSPSFSPWLAAHTSTLVAWIGAICTLGLYSVLYKENKVYRLFEHLFLGLATGYMVALSWNDVLLPKWWKPLWVQGEWWYIFALVPGLMYYLIFSRKHNWISRLIIGLFLGVASGQAFKAFVNDTWPQFATSFKPVIPHGRIAAGPDHPAIKALSVPDAINNILFMFILLCVLSYFFFSFEQKHPVVKGSAKLGRWLLMFTFGAIFGATIMARLALLIDRMDFLLNDFGPHIGGPGVMFGVLMALAVLVLYLVTRRDPNAEE
jgi:hypothetical protein